MKRIVRFISAILVLMMLLGSMPIITISSAEIESPFDSSMIGSSQSFQSATIVSKENIGDTVLYNTTLTSKGERRDTVKGINNGGLTSFEKRSCVDTFDGVQVAVGGKLFVYSKSANGKNFEPHYIQDIAAQFEKDHPEWKVAVVTNASFFDNEDSASADKGEPEDYFVEDGKVYKTYIEKGAYQSLDPDDANRCFKVGRGVVGLGDDGLVMYHTLENGTTHYTGSSPEITFSTYRLQVLGENKTNPVYSYEMFEKGILNYMSKPGFYTPEMGANNLKDATVYKIKCSQFRNAHVGVNGREVGNKTYYFEGVIESIIEEGTASMTVPDGYVYVSVAAPLENLQIGTTVRGTKTTSASWAEVNYAFGYKQQILHEGTVLFEGVHRESYSSQIHPVDGKYDETWSEDLSYACYGTNRTAVGFKSDGTPVVITVPRNFYGKYTVVENGTNVEKIVETSSTYSEMAWYMKSLGCVNAFMLDGGGSTGMYKKSEGSNTYEVACCDPLLDAPNRKVANALILAYPSGEMAKTDNKLAIPEYEDKYITATNFDWKEATVQLRKYDGSKSESSITSELHETIVGTEVTIQTNSNGRIATFYPTKETIDTGMQSIYAYTDLGYTVTKDTKYTYCFKLKSFYDDGYSSFLFADEAPNRTEPKRLNDFRALNGSFSNKPSQAEASQLSSVGIGWGRVQNANVFDRDGDDITESEVNIINSSLKLYLEGSAYSFYKIDIDGLNFTVKIMMESGDWMQLGGTYDLVDGSRLVLGYGAAAYGDTFYKRKISIKDPIIVDHTALANSIAAVDALNKDEYTSEGWEAIQAAKAKAAYSMDLVYQNISDYATTTLTEAVNSAPKNIDVVNANIAEYATYDSRGYTAESWAKYQAAYDALVSAKNANNYAQMEALNNAYAQARDNLVVQQVSIDVSWQTMNFVYSSGAQTWNPETHAYSGGQGTWTAKDDSNLISITNKTTSEILVDLKFTAASGFSGVSGKFYDGSSQISNELVLQGEVSKDITLELEGAISESTADNTKGGTVKITVSSND